MKSSTTPTAPSHRVVKPSVLYVGTPVVLVTTQNPDGPANITPISSAWALGDRLVLGFSASGQGIRNLMRDKTCVLNFTDPSLWRHVEAIARATGRKDVPEDKRAIGYEYVADKWALSDLTPCAAELVEPPRILECPIQIEAELVADYAAGQSETGGAPGFHIAETRALRVHAKEDIAIAGTNHIDTERWSPLIYKFRHYFGTGERLGKTFKAEY